MSNAGLGATWCAQGKATAEQWGKWLGVEITWFDGGLSIDKQRKAIDDMATKQWDFVAIQPFGIDTLVDPVKQMISKGIPVIQMDTTISKDDIGITTFLEPDNILMGSVVTDALFQQIGGKGNVIMTQGALGHTGAQGRAKGFHQTLDKYSNIKLLAEDPADWDVNKVAKLWEDYLVKYPAGQIQGAMFHNDDMALAARQGDQECRPRQRDRAGRGGRDAAGCAGRARRLAGGDGAQSILPHPLGRCGDRRAGGHRRQGHPQVHPDRWPSGHAEDRTWAPVYATAGAGLAGRSSEF